MLLAVHAGIRSELAGVERLAAAVVDGLSVDGLNQELEALRGNSTLWQFQVSCLRYCRFVHSHHHAEDTRLLRRTRADEPGDQPGRRTTASRPPRGLRPSGHGRSSRPSADRQRQPEARRAVADALDALKEHLLAHLDYEERNVAATARRLRDLPLAIQLPTVADSDPQPRRTTSEHHPHTPTASPHCPTSRRSRRPSSRSRSTDSASRSSTTSTPRATPSSPASPKAPR